MPNRISANVAVPKPNRFRTTTELLLSWIHQGFIPSPHGKQHKASCLPWHEHLSPVGRGSCDCCFTFRAVYAQSNQHETWCYTQPKHEVKAMAALVLPPPNQNSLFYSLCSVRLPVDQDRWEFSQLIRVKNTGEGEIPNIIMCSFFFSAPPPPNNQQKYWPVQVITRLLTTLFMTLSDYILI